MDETYDTAVELPPLYDDWKSHSIFDKNLPLSLSTTYDHMNEWTDQEGVDMRTGDPIAMSDGYWQHTNRERFIPEYHASMKENIDERFRRSYADLTSKIAYRYPNPGLPRERQGRIGGSWRHIREVRGHGGSNVLFIDGLVSMYDQEQFNHELHSELPHRPHVQRKMFSPRRHGGVGPGEHGQTPNYRSYSYEQEKPLELPPINYDINRIPYPTGSARTGRPSGSPGKYKGFYSYNS